MQISSAREFSWIKYLKKKRERERRNQRRILHPLRENVLKRRFALVMQRMLSAQSALGSKEAMFKRVSFFFFSLQRFLLLLSAECERL